jgi:hypothetical protein
VKAYKEIILNIDFQDENENAMLRIVHQHRYGEWELDHGGPHKIMLDAGGNEILKRTDAVYIGGKVL